MPITFQELWSNHPTISGEEQPCRTGDRPNFDDQCTIRMGRALALSGLNTSSLSITHCWFHPSSEGHTLRAEDLAIALTNRRISGIGSRQKTKPNNFQCELAEKTGIIFFKDYWQRSLNHKREAWGNRSGDHIDLWNGSRLTDWRSWLGISCLFGFVAGSQDQSKEIWFWPVQ